MLFSTSIRLLVLVTFFIAVTASLFAQNSTSINGRVTDRQGSLIPGATITIYERDNRTRVTAITNESGRYNFEQLAPGEYIIEVERRGFANLNRELRVGGTRTETIDFQLEPGGIAEEVVVTASSTAQPVDEVSKAISIIDNREIELRDEYSITEALRTVPGLRIRQTNGPGSLTTISTRGLRNEDTAVLIDGLRFRDASTLQGDATSFLSDLLIVNTDRLEVLRGSGSSLYGTNAVGGVINIITDEGGGDLRGELQAEGGGLGFFRTRAKFAGGGFQDRLHYSAGVAHLNVSRGVDGNDATRNTSGQSFLRFNFTPRISLTGRIFAGDAFGQLNDSPSAIPANTQGFVLPPVGQVIRAVPLARDEQRRLEAAGRPFGTLAFTRGDATFVSGFDDPDNRREARFFSGALTFAQRLSDTASYRINYQRTATSRIFRDGQGGLSFEPFFNQINPDADGRIDTLNARTDFRIGRFNFINAGYEFERETYASRALNEDPSPATRVDNFTGIRQRSHTLFTQDQLRFLDDRLQLAAAVRAQFFNVDQPEFRGGASPYAGITLEAPPTALTGDGSISYFFRSTGTKLRGHVGNGYRAPSSYERFGAGFFFGASFYGDPRLRPDRSVAFDAGIDQTFARGRIRTSATYFYTRLQEVIAFLSLNPATDPFRRTGGYVNTGGGLARGVELSFAAAPTRSTEISTTYTYTNADNRRPQIPGFVQALNISDHIFTVVANQRIGRRVDVTFDLYSASDYLFGFFVGSGTRAYQFDGPLKADLGASYTLPLDDDRRSLRFYGKVENLFDREYFEGGFRTPGAFFVGGTTFRF